MELLNTSADRNEIKVGTQILDFVLEKRGLQTHVIVESISSPLRIDVHDAALSRQQVIHVERRREDNAPILRTEAGIAVVELAGKAE